MTAPTKQQRAHWDKVASMGCMVCGAMPEIHHCFTGFGGRKDHSKVIGLCWLHHRGPQGIHFMGRKAWQRQFGSEQEWLDKLERLLQDG